MFNTTRQISLLWTCQTSQSPRKTIAPKSSCDNNFHRSIFSCGKSFLFVLVLKVSHTVFILYLMVLELEPSCCVTLLVLSTCIIFVCSYLLSKLTSCTLLTSSSFCICVIYCPPLNFVNILMEMKESEFYIFQAVAELCHL